LIILEAPGAMNFSIESTVKQLVFLMLTMSGERVRAHCNVCDTRDVIFCSNAWVRAGVCSKCRSESRHRILAAALQYSDELNYGNLLYKKNVIHIAPEPALQKYISTATLRYVPGDISPSRKGERRIDLSHMPEFADESFETIIAIDVFEHIADDGAAFRECRRVLKEGGYLIISVPMPDRFSRTDEDRSVASDADRTKFYGQYNHVRLYGRDLIERIRQNGYNPVAIDANAFTQEVRRKHNLEPEGVLHPLATNNRTIIFAKKMN
jgi:SAM-dependent methyltransferase